MSTDRLAALRSATAGLQPPFAVVDLDAFDANAAALTARAAPGTTIRLASKSVRCRVLSDRALARPGFAGVLALTLPEALWLAADHDDVVVGYPSVDTDAVAALATDPALAARVTLMVDSVESLDVVEAAVGRSPAAPVKVCLDLDAALELLGGRVHLGPLRSPVRTPAQAVALARAVLARPWLHLDGLMAYEGQIAGTADAAGPRLRQAAVRAVQRASARELAERRAAVVEAVSALAPLRFVNGGGTGSVEQTSAEPVVTEVAAGSGLYAPALFDSYRRFRARPAAFFVQPVVRRPSPRVATALGGGWIASGPPGPDRQPVITWPRGLRYSPLEGAGEAQTPLLGPRAGELRLGDRVWFRHAKAGELCERVGELHLVSGHELVGAVPTYRGEGKAFL
ncbi:D-serine deaminase, pyridoxal phosphate-dependent [Klenkia marina]|uniref:D-serine deaminase, pyridoxal phosphate-dependent n=1 Tax=Klenkia marina TaxID=1960309 RepID=A0A1G4XI12_9ACTN|nr:alanine racemase [Klenkia marina]SCX40829.1 D-serine deaminase, pyridoxal phosphate-dependent [Klenkia marina]